jgi:hypothetical protein
MKLTDSLAARRQVYARSTAAMPDIVVIDIPARYASPTLSLGRFYPIMVETELEMIELAHFLALCRPDLVAPDLLDYRSSALQAQPIRLSHYDPPEPGWPYILLCQWPLSCTQLVQSSRALLARGAYTIEMFTTAFDRCNATEILQRSLCNHGLGPALITC